MNAQDRGLQNYALNRDLSCSLSKKEELKAKTDTLSRTKTGQDMACKNVEGENHKRKFLKNGGMTQKAMKALNALKKYRLKTDMWGVVEDCEDIWDELGAYEHMSLDGQWLYIYSDAVPYDFYTEGLEYEEMERWEKEFGEPDIRTRSDVNVFIMLYKI